MTDPNKVGFTTKGTVENRDGEGTYGDMIFNRPAGQWTIRFYIRSVSTQGGNYFDKVYGYTITGSESNDIYLTYRTGKFIRTYSVYTNLKVYHFLIKKCTTPNRLQRYA